MANARKTAVKALVKVNSDSAYSNITLLNALKETPDMSPADKSLAAALFYGVLDRKITLDYFLSKFVKTKIQKLPPITREALRIAVYQFYFTDKIPESLIDAAGCVSGCGPAFVAMMGDLGAGKTAVTKSFSQRCGVLGVIQNIFSFI